MLLLVACDEGSQRDAPRRDDLSPTDIELGSATKEELLALANNRDAWFLASDITTEALEELYGSAVTDFTLLGLVHHLRQLHEADAPAVMPVAPATTSHQPHLLAP